MRSKGLKLSGLFASRNDKSSIRVISLVNTGIIRGTASGSGVGSGTATGVLGPTANAGPDLLVGEGDSVVLDGTLSTGASTYQWTQNLGGAVVLSGDTTSEASFTAPTLGAPLFTDSQGTIQSTTSDDITLTIPASAQTGDTLVACVAHRGSGGFTSTVSGWNKIGERVSASQDVSVGIFIRKHDGVATTATFGSWSSKKSVGVIGVLSNSFDIADGNYQTAAATSSSIALPVITSRNGPAIAIWAVAGDANTTPGSANNGVDELYEGETTSGTACALWVGYDSIATVGGSSATSTFTPQSSAPHVLMGIAVLAKPESETLGFELEVGNGITTDTDTTSVVVQSYASENLPDSYMVATQHPSNQPRSVETGSKVFYSGTNGSDGTIRVAAYDTSGDSNVGGVVADLAVDDHTHCSILAPTDKPPIVVYNNHDGDSNIRVRTGTVNHDLSSLGSEVLVGFGSTTSYNHVWRRLSTDEVHLFTRYGGNEQWAVKVSTDWASTWGATAVWFDGSDRYAGNWYMLAAQRTSGLLNVVMHPGGLDPEFMFCTIDLATGDISKADGTTVDNYKSPTSLPITAAELDTVFTASAGRFARAWAVADTTTPTILYVDDVQAGSSNGDYKVARWNGSSWSHSTITTTGTLARGGSGGLWHGGGEFFPGVDNQVILTREQSGTWYCEKWETSDYTTWTNASTLLTSSQILSRPVAMTNYFSVCRYVSFNDYDDFDGQTEIWALA